MLDLVGVGYRYPDGQMACVAVDLQVAAGELVVLTGPTGCGKSTLLRLAAGLLPRHGSGQRTGAVSVGGGDPATMAPVERIRRVGFVSQSPDRQIVTGTLGDEIAFGLESAGATADVIETRVAELLAALDLPRDPDRATSALSGGQRQRLVVAAALAPGPRLLLLDEPLAHLDPAAARALLRHLRAQADAGVAVVIVEHRLEPCRRVCDRVIAMQGGRVIGEPTEQPVPSDATGPGAEPSPGRRLLRTGPLRWRWPHGSNPALDCGPLTVCAGERIAIVGPNGAGKSTLLGVLGADLRVGGVEGAEDTIAVPQDPDLALFCETVARELDYGPMEQRVEPAERRRRVATAASDLSITDLLDRSPQALSRGQRLRAAVAAALTCARGVVLLDEPTSGQDPEQVEALMVALRDPDRAVVFATHDLDLARRHATRVLVLVRGAVVYDGAPEEAEDALRSAGLVEG